MIRTIPTKESLTVEFKSDRSRLPDRELVETVVCLANTDGGEIYLGVEDNGQVTGLHPQHQNLSTLAAMIANRTNPPVSVRVTALEEEGKIIAQIEVPKSLRLVATSDGLLQRRRLQADGTLQCVPFYPHEFASRQSDVGILDYSSLPITGATIADFDPLERERLRQERRLDTTTLAHAIQRNEAIARSVLERLVEAGLVEAHGVKKGRTYTLSPQVYREV
jgi:ATP-dependent DNA helicase RecG